MGRYVDKPLWEEEILLVDEGTPVLGGEPVWDATTGRLIDGFANIPAAMLADRTRYLKQEIDQKPTRNEVENIANSSNGVYDASIVESEGATVNIVENTGQKLGQVQITLKQPITEILVGIPTTLGTYRTIVLLLKQGTGANLVEWGSNIHFQSGNAPLLSYDVDSVDIVRLVSDPAVSGRWYGFFDGAWMI